MGLFTDGDGIPLAFNLFPGSQNEQTSLKPLEEKIITEFGCKEFIFCSDAGLCIKYADLRQITNSLLSEK